MLDLTLPASLENAAYTDLGHGQRLTFAPSRIPLSAILFSLDRDGSVFRSAGSIGHCDGCPALHF